MDLRSRKRRSGIERAGGLRRGGAPRVGSECQSHGAGLSCGRSVSSGQGTVRGIQSRAHSLRVLFKLLRHGGDAGRAKARARRQAWPLDGLRATLRDSSSYLSSRVSYKCETSPPIASPATEYLYTSDEHHRLQGRRLYRVFHPLARAQAGRTCTLTRNLDWRYTLACPLQPTGRGTLSGAGDLLAVHYQGSKPDDAFSVLADGTLRLQSRNPQVKMDLLPGAAEGDTQAQDAGGAVGRDGGGGGAAAGAPAPTRGPAATPEQCAKMAADLQMLRAKRTDPPSSDRKPRDPLRPLLWALNGPQRQAVGQATRLHSIGGSEDG